jgi:hypothetical protein
MAATGGKTMNLNYPPEHWHIGMRGKIDYPGTSLHGKEAMIERFYNGEVLLSYDLGKTTRIWHRCFVPKRPR